MPWLGSGRGFRRSGLLARTRGFVAAVASLLLLASAAQAGAQGDNPAPDASAFTLHVYTNLVQVPALILNRSYEPVANLEKSKVLVQIEGEKPFAPTRMRLEGEDPITLGVLLDLSQDDELARGSPEALAALVPRYLHPQDHLLVWAVDCKIVRALGVLPANSAAIQQAVSAVIHSPVVHGDHTGPACARTLPLWRAMATMALELAKTPGRHVLLTVTMGANRESGFAFDDLMKVIRLSATAAFGLVTSPTDFPDARSFVFANVREDYERFALLCGSSGGLTMGAVHDTLQARLQTLFTLLRSRYIVEFPRPRDVQAGTHLLHLSVPGSPTIVRAAGVSMPIRDPDPAPTDMRADPAPGAADPAAAIAPSSINPAPPATDPTSATPAGSSAPHAAAPLPSDPSRTASPQPASAPALPPQPR